jgi:hypothetical protein
MLDKSERKNKERGDGKKEMRKRKDILMSHHRRNTAVHDR